MASIRTLQTFLATAARLGSFAAAGKEVNLTAAAVGPSDPRARSTSSAWPCSTAAPGPSCSTPRVGAACRRRQGAGRALAATARPARTAMATWLVPVVMGALVSALMGAFADALWTLKRRHPGAGGDACWPASRPTSWRAWSAASSTRPWSPSPLSACPRALAVDPAVPRAHGLTASALRPVGGPGPPHKAQRARPASGRPTAPRPWAAPSGCR
jgi:hypothetical protein